MSPLLPAEYFHVRTISLPVEPANLPPELRDEARHFAGLTHWLEAGYTIEVHTLKKTPEPLIKAIQRIAYFTQEGTVFSWLPPLWREGVMPTFAATELRRAEREGVPLYEDARFVLEHRGIGKRLVCTDPEHQGAREEREDFFKQLNAALLPQSIDELLHRVACDEKVGESGKELLFKIGLIGTSAHVLEGLMPGWGKGLVVFAGSPWEEGKELAGLHRAGFTSRQCVQRASLVVCAGILASAGIYGSEMLASQGRVGLAGVLFGCSLIITPTAMAIRSFRKTYQALKRRKQAGKGRAQEPNLTMGVMREHLSRPYDVSTYRSFIATPVLAALVFTVFPKSGENGWVLALLGTTEVWLGKGSVFCQNKLHQGIFTELIRGLRRKKSALDEGQKMR